MALTVVRPCVVCGALMETKRASKQTCSDKCSKQNYRASRREKQATIITIEETPMSNTVPMQFTFSDSEYQSRCENAKGFYMGRIESPATSLKGAIVEFAPAPIEIAFEQYHKLRTEGYTPFDAMSPLPSINIVQSPIAGSLVTLYMLKPQDQQEADLEIIFETVRRDYETELERELEEHINRTVQSLIDAEDRAREKAEEELLEQRQQQKREEVLAARAKLRSELIGSGKLNADGGAA